MVCNTMKEQCAGVEEISWLIINIFDNVPTTCWKEEDHRTEYNQEYAECKNIMTNVVGKMVLCLMELRLHQDVF